MKYTDTWVKLQKKALGTGSTCDAPRYVDNGNGTIGDNLTGLNWEQKTTSALHDKDDTFYWHNANWAFLSRNGSAAGLNETIDVFCFGASVCDWRLPTVAEL